MKTLKLEMEQPRLGRKPKKMRVDQRIIAKLGNAIYHVDDVQGVSIKVKYKNGTATVFSRSEDDDRADRIKGKWDKQLDDEDDD